jgi:hypothetical protein
LEPYLALEHGISWVDVVNHVIVPEVVVMLLQEDTPGLSEADAVTLFYESRNFDSSAFADMHDSDIQDQLMDVADAFDGGEVM